ncbi:MAG: hypothetical protein ABSD97_04525 [Acidimicrobiales bacterium]
MHDEDTSYSAVAAAGPDDGFAAGSTCSPKCAGILATTDDGGAAWSLESTGRVLGVQLEFASASDGFLLGYTSSSPPCGSGLSPCDVLLSTVDSGRHWSSVRGGLAPIWSMAFVSPYVGVVAVDTCKESSKLPVPPAPCGGRIELTLDAGKRWATVLRTSAPIITLAHLPGRYGRSRRARRRTTFRQPRAG